MAFVLIQSITLSVLNCLILYGENYKVEARPKEVVPVPGWFNNVEGFILPNFKEFRTTEPSYVNKHVDNTEFYKSLIEKKSRKKRKRTTKKIAKQYVEEEDRMKPHEHGTKKKKHKPRGHALRFTKVETNGNAKDSKVSESKEKHGDRGPVDIIVHIKMNE